MRKFTIFTILLTVIIVVVLSDIFVNDYLPKFRKDSADADNLELTLPENLELSGNMTANVLGADVDPSAFLDYGESDEYGEYEEVILDVSGDPALSRPVDFIPFSDEGIASVSDVVDFENENYVSFTTNVLIREDQVKSAGFVGAYLENEPHNGFLYKTIYIDDLYDVEVKKTLVRSADTLLAKVYVFQVGPLSSLNEVYEVLKVRGSEGLDVEVNENDEFGSGSFYMNDARRSGVVFLTVKIGSYIYGFSYPKEYHSQVKNLITLLDLEF